MAKVASDPGSPARLIAQRYVQGKVGGLEKCAGEVTPLARGRGGRRLAMLASLLRTWHAMLDAHDR